MREGRAIEGVAKKSAGVSEEALEKAEETGGELTKFQIIRHRVRYFIDGAEIGGSSFVEKVFAAHRGMFGKKRETGARKLRGADWGGLRVLRDLRTKVIGESKLA